MRIRYINSNFNRAISFFIVQILQKAGGGGIFGKTTNDAKTILAVNIANVYNAGTIDSSLNLIPGVTISRETHTTLLDDLNAWGDANKSTYPELKNWVMGSSGYPTFAK